MLAATYAANTELKNTTHHVYDISKNINYRQGLSDNVFSAGLPGYVFGSDMPYVMKVSNIVKPSL